MSSNLKKLKSNFSDKELFNLALTHKSASKKNNERLEFLGDAIINFYVTLKLYENYTDIQEGKLTRLRASLVSREFLNDLGLAIGLSKAVKLGKGESTENNSIVGNAFEAVVGAIFLDTGLEDTKQFLDTLYSEEFSKLKPLEDWKDSKSQLQEILQKQGLALPKYKVVDRGPKYNEDRFEINCTSPDLDISATGKGKSRKIAEQEAAKLLLEVSLIGKTNVGKSTLLNKLIEQKVSITSRKPQTTRQRLLGIKTKDRNQIIYVDTPGFHQGHQRALNKFMNKVALSSIEGVDIVLFVVEALNFTETDSHLLKQISNENNHVILVINKIDKITKKEKLIPFVDEISKFFTFSEVIPISALKGKNIDILEKEISARLPVGNHLYPKDQIADTSERFLTSEIIREKCITRVGDEVPYRLTVIIDSFKEEESLITIDGTIFVEKKSQKGIVIGEQGKRLKSIGTAARKDLEKMLGSKVMLRLWVKVKKDWTNDQGAMNSMGYKIV